VIAYLGSIVRFSAQILANVPSKPLPPVCWEFAILISDSGLSAGLPAPTIVILVTAKNAIVAPNSGAKD
jgi:hypothetical protein